VKYKCRFLENVGPASQFWGGNVAESGRYEKGKLKVVISTKIRTKRERKKKVRTRTRT